MAVYKLLSILTALTLGLTALTVHAQTLLSRIDNEELNVEKAVVFVSICDILPKKVILDRATKAAHQLTSAGVLHKNGYVFNPTLLRGEGKCLFFNGLLRPSGSDDNSQKSIEALQEIGQDFLQSQNAFEKRLVFIGPRNMDTVSNKGANFNIITETIRISCPASAKNDQETKTNCQTGSHDSCSSNSQCVCTGFGEYGCACGPGYYGNGQDCKACPEGTYKRRSVNGPASLVCQRCLPNQISAPASSQPFDCQCKEGFTQEVDGAPCVPLRCPPLQVPDHGFLIGGVCDSVVYAACGFGCDQGFRMSGSSLRLCQANGTWAGHQAVCTGNICPLLTTPEYGSMECQREDRSYGTVCKFSCSDEYTLIGSVERTCLSAGIWSGLTASCQQAGCPALSPIINGFISPESCVTGRQTVGSQCTADCQPGFNLIGSAFMQCTSIGLWTSSSTKCVDNSPPVLTCPPDLTISTMDGLPYGITFYPGPNVTDTSFIHPVKPYPSHLEPTFPIGDTVITYLAEDIWGNNASCSLTVTVVDEEPPSVGECISPSPVVLANDQFDVDLELPLPQFVDNSGHVEVLPFQRAQSFPLGQTVVTVTAVDGSGNSATCDLIVRVVSEVTNCGLNLTLGQVICREDECTILCEPGHSLPQFIPQFTCREVANLEVALPDCTVEEKNQLSVYFENSNLLCQDIDQASVQKDLLHEEFSVLLPPEDIIQWELEINSCLPNDPVVYVLLLHVIPDFPLSIDEAIDLLFDAAANIGFLISSSDQFAELLVLEPEIGCPPGQTLLDFICLKCPPGTFLDPLTRECAFCDLGTYQDKHGQTICKPCPGTTTSSQTGAASAFECFEPCEPGTFSSTGLGMPWEQCQKCAMGSFQPAFEQMSCQECPQATRTIGVGSVTESDCKSMCVPGTASKSGMEPCAPCPIGYYAEEFGMLGCLECPGQQITPTTGSASNLDCEPDDGFSDASKTVVNTNGPLLLYNECFIWDCQNGATCQGVNGGFYCRCAPGFAGEFCEEEINECLAQPCLNSGKCQNTRGGFECECIPGFSGKLCEIPVDSCSSSPCLNGASCVNTREAYSCKCSPGFHGAHCELDENECESNPCHNDAPCLDLAGEFYCNCSKGFEGPLCDLQTNGCDKITCQNRGSCINLLGSFRCECEKGYSGIFCEMNPDDCEDVACLNGGFCSDGLEDFTCLCSENYAGKLCDLELTQFYTLVLGQNPQSQDLELQTAALGRVTEWTVSFWIQFQRISPVYISLTETFSSQQIFKISSSFSKFTFDLFGTTLETPEIDLRQWHLVSITGLKDGTVTALVDESWKDTVKINESLHFTDAKLLVSQSAQVILSFLNIWARGLSPSQHSELYWSCSHESGDLINWPRLKPTILSSDTISSSVVLNSTNFCSECSQPEELEHGEVIWDSARPGATLTHKCDEGFAVRGPESRTCLLYSQWSEFPATCETIVCSSVPSVKFATATVTSIEFGGKASYECDQRHLLQGSNELRCNASGLWEGDLPRCVESDCKLRLLSTANLREIPPIPYAYILPSQTIEVECIDPELEIRGNKIVSCQSSGNWPQLPQCVPPEKFCGDAPAAPPNGVLVTPPSNLPSKTDEAYYSCDTGYRLDFSSDTAIQRNSADERIQLLCQNSVWDLVSFQCVRIKCPEVIPPESALKIEYLGIRLPGDELKWTCVEGFTLEGKERSTCQEDGSWSPGAVPTCKRILCPFIRSVPHGYIDSDQRTPGSNINFYCYKGYEIKNGPSSLTCSDIGEWALDQPKCTPIECNRLPSIQHGQFVPNQTPAIVNTSAILECVADFAPFGDSASDILKPLICNSEGEWEGVSLQITCIHRTCWRLPEIPNAEVIDHATSWKANVKCKEGFEFTSNGRESESIVDEDGSSTIVIECDINRGWYFSSLPSCSQVQCPMLATIPNGDVSVTSTLHGSIALYKCKDGFNLVGLSNRNCEPTGKWSGTVPQCDTIECPAISASIENGIATHTGQTYRSTVMYDCIKGYSLSGPIQRQCLADGTWSNVEPKCVIIKCPQPEGIRNGNFILTSQNFGGELTYQCNEGFSLSGPRQRQCRVDGTWSNIEPKCVIIKCPQPEGIRNGNFILTSQNFGGELTYQCNEGFSLSGPRQRQCLADGTWSNEEPKCIVVECPEPEIIENGNFRLTSQNFGGKLTYQCNEGFSFSGPRQRQCLADGTWSNEEPKCIVVECPEPEVIENGNFRLTSQNFGGKLTYQCNEGFSLSGPNPRQCLADGTWSNIEPKCVIVKCPQPEGIRNGNSRLTSQNFGGELTYQCNEGFSLSGPNRRQCLADGTWSNIEPKCVIVNCPQPEVIRNGNFRLTDQNFGGELTYQCNEGFSLSGSRQRQCLADGTWSNEEPKCVIIKCPQPEGIRNGNFILTSQNFGGELTYQCNEGFSLSGPNQRQCLADGTWSNIEPKCVATKCLPPQDIEKGNFRLTTLTIGGILSYQCDEGYSLSGQKQRQCLSDGTWSNAEPMCLVVNCPPPQATENGKFNFTGRTFGSTVSYRCNDGYSLLGSSRRQCLSDGTWSNDEPECVVVKCPPPKDIVNGKFRFTRRSFEGQLLYQCNEGFSLSGPRQRQCRADGTWSNVEPKCIVVKCPKPEVIRNGNFRLTSQNFGGELNYECNEGFSLSGPNRRQCRADGTWSNIEPKCVTVKCPSPEVIGNGNFRLTNQNFGGELTYQCNEGFSLSGPNRRQCLADGIWSNVEPKCVIVKCPRAVGIRNGNFRLTSQNFGGELTYQCNEGFSLSGPNRRRCLADGTWSNVEPKCVIVKCPRAVGIKNGNFRLTSQNFGGELTYQCSEGFSLSGPRQRQCLADGTWSNVEPKCVIIKCPQPEGIRNGNFILISLNFGGELTYQCNEGYSLSGPNQRQCLADGTWSNIEPKCVIVKCPQAVGIRNGNFKLTSLNFGGELTYQCNEGFSFSGPRQRQCRADGTWSNIEPKCVIVKCPQPEGIRNGNFILTSQHFGGELTYKCNEGFSFSGPRQRQCRADGTWSNIEPKCAIVKCPQPEGIRNGKFRLTSQNFGGELTYHCNEGFSLSGSNRRQCLTEGNWSNVEPKCVAVKCPPPQPIENGILRLTSQLFRGQLSYKCNDGYTLVGQATLFCNSIGSWDRQAPHCVKIQCNAISPPEYGTISFSNQQLEPTTEALLVCNNGYAVTGRRRVACESDGSWNADLGTCVEIFCQNPPNLRNGLYTYINRKPDSNNKIHRGTEVTYACKPGFLLIGTKFVSECLPNGSWQPVDLQCSLIRCPQPENIRNGGYTIVDTTHLQNVSYFCNEFYVLRGQRQLQCDNSGNWAGNVPTCEKVECHEIESPKGGTVVFSNGYLSGSIATLSCDGGSKIIGLEQIICKSTGGWDGNLGQCTGITCEKLPNLRFGIVSLNGSPIRRANVVFQVSDVVGFKCSRGYTLLGPRSRVCLSNGTWSDEMPACPRVRCTIDKIPIIENGRFVVTGINYGDTIFARCNSGYYLADSDRLRCGPDSSWEGAVPTCVRLSCPSLETPENGVIKTSQTFFSGSDVVLQCDTGYKIRGNRIVYCNTDGTWSNVLGACSPVFCNALSGIRNGQYVSLNGSISTNKKYRYQDTLNHTCRIGYTSSNFPTRTCQSDGNWSGSRPVCNRIVCRSPRPIRNGRYRLTRSAVGARLTYSCNRGFVLQGTSVLQCGENSLWQGEVPVCVRDRCPVIGPANHGSYRLSNNHYINSQASLECNEGFKSDGLIKIHCLKNATWSGSLGSCRPIYCAPPPTLAKGYFTPNQPRYEVDESVTYFCNEGHIYSGPKTRRCLSDGTWDEVSSVCVPAVCLQPVRIPNGRFNADDTTFNKNVTYFCVDGFSLKGNNKQRCGPDGLWEGSVPECIKSRCSFLETPQNGFIHLSNSTYIKSRAALACNAGYKVEGTQSILCQDSGIWTGALGVCEPIHCGKPPVLAHGHFKSADNLRMVLNEESTFLLGATVKYGCNHGYKIVGNSRERTCLTDGQWSPSDSECIRIRCPDPTPPIGGSLVISLKRGKDVAEYFCGTGTRLVGVNERECLPTGKWSGVEPRCEVIKCPNLNVNVQDITSTVKMTLETDKDGLHANFSCIPGHYISGQSIIHCLANETWSHPVPDCEPITCVPHQPLENGAVIGTQLFGNTITYVCDSGYYLVNDKLLDNQTINTNVCDEKGQWISSLPQCNESVDCPRPEPIANGRFQNLNLLNDTIYYSCRIGYFRDGPSHRTCHPNGKWSTDPPSCRLIKCPASTVPNGFLPAGRYGSTARTVCDSGFVLDSEEIAYCQRSGSWVGTIASCIPANCSHPPNVTNGYIRYDERKPVSSSVIVCDVGFRIRGSDAAYCTWRGTWTVEGSCVGPTCPHPGKVPNARLLGKNRQFYSEGERVSIVCSVNHKIEGQSVMECLANGHWTGPIPECVPTFGCPEPKKIMHGTFRVQPSLARKFVTYKCDTGFYLRGRARQQCLPSNRWSSRPPRCYPYLCSPPPTLENASFQPRRPRYHVGLAVTYSCLPGYQFAKGKKILSCQPNRRWEDDHIVCVQSCLDIISIPNGQVETSISDVNYTASFTCSEGYKLEGPSSLICLDGVWNTIVPKCSRIECSSPPSIPNGIILESQPTYYYLSTVEYECFDGYEMVGTNGSIMSRTCLAEGTWSLPAPLCHEILCDIPKLPTNGRITGSNSRRVGTALTFTCEDGFNLVPNNSATQVCQVNGSWAPNDSIVCIPVQCPLFNITHGSVSYNPTTRYWNSIANIDCSLGFDLIGVRELNCNSEGNWNSAAPICEPLSPCGSPPEDLPGASFKSSDGILAQYECIDASPEYNAPLYRCDDDADEIKQWKWLQGSCTDRVVCPSSHLEEDSPVDPNLIMSEDGPFAVGTTIEFSCANPFELVGLTRLTCNESGLWTGDFPKCLHNYCLQAPAVRNGRTGPIINDGGRSTAAVTCNAGFEFGTSYVEAICINRYGWILSRLPTCVPQTCPDPPSIDHGSVRIESDLALYLCEDGYNITPESFSSLQCSAGNWVGLLPQCTLSGCGEVPVVENGRTYSTNTNIGSIALLLCSPGYEADGERLLVCQRGSSWSNSGTKCVRRGVVGCRDPPQPPYTRAVVQSRFAEGETVIFRCTSGHTGSVSIRCSRGVWTSPLGECTSMSCGRPTVSFPVQVYGSNFDVQSVVITSCPSGYTRVGPSFIVCRSSGEWTQPPSCERNGRS